MLLRRFVFVSLWTSLRVQASFAFNDSFVKLIDDIVGSLIPAVRVSAHLCRLDEDDAVILSKRMSSRGLSHEIHRDLKGFTTRTHDTWDHRVLYVLDLDCEYAISMLKEANATGMFVAPIRWLLLRDFAADTDDDSTNMFEQMAVYPDSEVILARKHRPDFASLISVYRISRFHGVTIEDRGNWTFDDGVRLKDFYSTTRRRMNLHRTPLNTCLVMSDPDTMNHLTDFEHRHIDAVTKSNYPWLLYIIDRMNATVNVRVTNTWGYMSENGSWSGMIGMLQRREIDLGGTSTFLIPQRIGVIDYVQLYTRTGSRFILRQPLLSTISNIFTLPFARSVWSAIGVLLLLVLVLLYLSSMWEHRRGLSGPGAEYWQQMNPARQTFSDNFMVILGAMAQQGYSYEPYRVPTRIVTLMLLIAALSLYASYTANIVALLQSTTDSVKTLADLLNSPFKCGTHDNVYNRYYFKSFQDPVRRTLVEEKIEPKGKNDSWMTLEEGVGRVRNELFAFHAEIGSFYKLMQETYQEEEKCGITEIDMLKVVDPLFAVQARSPYKEIIKNTALLLGETGLKTRDEHRIYTAKPKCHGQTSFISIGFTECSFALVAMGYGTLLSLIVLIAEFVWRNMRSRWTNENELENELEKELGNERSAERFSNTSAIDRYEDHASPNGEQLESKADSIDVRGCNV